MVRIVKKPDGTVMAHYSREELRDIIAGAKKRDYRREAERMK